MEDFVPTGKIRMLACGRESSYMLTQPFFESDARKLEIRYGERGKGDEVCGREGERGEERERERERERGRERGSE